MFLIQSKGVDEVFTNGWDSDFLRFIPRQRNCEPEEIEVCYLDPSRIADIQRAYPGTMLKLVAIGQNKVEVRVNGAPVAELTGRKCLSWPYDESGRFLGNQFEE